MFDTQNQFETCSCSETCLNSDYVIPALHETFKFIQSHPTDFDIQQVDCVLTLKISLLQYENNQTTPPIKMTTNTIYGKIKKVHSTFVELSFPTVENELFDYTISFENIITLGSSSLSVYYEEYLDYLSNLPPLCPDQYDSSYRLLLQLHKILADTSLPQQYSITFISAGILSQTFNLADITIIKNLILVQNYLVIPITQLSGFVITPLD